MVSLALIVLGVLLIGWGGVLLLTGEFVATLDIAAGLVSSGVVVIALAAIARALDRLGERFPLRDDDDEEEVELELPPLDIATSPVFPVSPIPAPVAAAEPALQEPMVEAPEITVPAAEPAEVPEVAPAPAAKVVEPPAGPSLIREGMIDGRMYRFFDDGSIEAEGPEGVRRFKSMDEAREAILQERRPASTEDATPKEPEAVAPQPETAPTDVKPAPDAKPDTPARQPIFQTPIREEPVVANPAPSAPSGPPSKRQSDDRKQRKPVTWESYLAAGRIQENGEKTETKDSAAEEGGGKAEAAPAEAKPDEPAAAQPPSGAWAEPFRALLQDDKKKDKKEKPDES
ncbi:hypothetical protein [Flaviflagellibacter deserti]|uniref:Uncharacterized protein n=1 Tax=Flaviflagellibacter deserti TaxID=2267266 RepID=A0ABV9Z1X2_9HYPH